MPTYIKISPLKTNLCGIASRGYVINRRDNTVFVKYGAINSNIRKFYWAGRRLPNLVPKKFRTIEAAKKFYKSKIRMVERESYIKLPPGKRILKWKEMYKEF